MKNSAMNIVYKVESFFEIFFFPTHDHSRMSYVLIEKKLINIWNTFYGFGKLLYFFKKDFSPVSLIVVTLTYLDYTISFNITYMNEA